MGEEMLQNIEIFEDDWDGEKLQIAKFQIKGHLGLIHRQ